MIKPCTLVPTRDHSIAEQSKNYRYSTNHQVVIDADTHLVVAIGRPVPGNRHDSKAWEESGAKAAVGQTTTIADGGYLGAGLVIPHRRPPGGELPEWKQEHNHSTSRSAPASSTSSPARSLMWPGQQHAPHPGRAFSPRWPPPSAAAAR